jgi:eukaryotic-like serine/threonine-protein kinase
MGGRSPDRHGRLRAVFDEALLHDPSTREAYVDRACAGDPDLRRMVMRLLAAHHDAGSFLESPPDRLLSQARAQEQFRGTDRFRVIQRLGAGGMGVVYEVHDDVRDEIVALKTLRQTNAAAVYRLKREFRSLADVAHVNLACLYELFVEDDRCFFTMELVRGVNFVHYVRGADRAGRSDDRLTSALRQLIDGVAALHRRGKLHRDVKPSNVLVTGEGRVVILDFGLLAELRPQDAADASYLIGGTPAYMPPEEGTGAPPSEAGDWYGVGVTLYEALTGTLPFASPAGDLLFRKRTWDPPAPVQLAPDVPPELNLICVGLMCRDPARRLSGAGARRWLAGAGPAYPVDTTASIRDASFVGRDRQLRALSGAFDSVVEGHAKAVCVYGPSGIGKSALVRRFLGDLATRPDVVVLSGRCYENETVPYKALDHVVDDLSHHLASAPSGTIEGVIPPDVAALTRVFPVMLQVDAIAKMRAARDRESADPLSLRRRAFAALRELLDRLARRHPLVICIDDLQWADADSIVLLEELLRPPGPPMFTVLCFRSEETATKAFLQAFLARGGQGAWSAVSLEPMTEAEAQTLIAGLLPADSGLLRVDRSRLAQEAAGSPFVLEQLARYAAVNRIATSQAPGFAEMFAARLEALSSDARRFLEALAICGRPMAPELICAACGVTRDRLSLVTMLRGSQLIRSSGSSERIEAYHDRIREVIAARIAPDARRDLHRRMVQALVEEGSDDCEALFDHYRGAGDAENASVQAGLAAARSAAALAFDRAAVLYRHALALAPAAAAGRAWKEGLANALANAGRPAEAAAAYLDAAQEAEPAARVELQRRGAEQFLIGGNIDSGLDLIRTMIASMGGSVPRTPRAALVSLLRWRARLHWRGLRFVARPVDAIDPETLLRIDTCWSATTGLLLVDLIAASEFSARHLLMALEAGDPFRVARGMAIESIAWNAFPTGRRFLHRLIQDSKTLAERAGTPHAMALCTLSDGMIAISRGEWKKSAACAERALAILRDQCVGVPWELNIAQNLFIWSMMYQGQLGELSRLVPAVLANARSSGNLYIATELCTRSNFVWLAADDPDQGERETRESIAGWSQKGFHRQHYSARLARVQTALYRGNAEAAWRLLIADEPALRRSLMTRVHVLRVESSYLRARCALAMAGATANHKRFLPIARTEMRVIARERMPWSDPIAMLLAASVANLEGNPSVASRHLHEAIDRFERADMHLYAAAARCRIGALPDDPSGRDMQRQGEAWMAGQGISNPVAMTRMLAPGFADAHAPAGV